MADLVISACAMLTLGCSVADLANLAPAMEAWKRKLGQASPRAASHTKQLEQRAIIQTRRSRRADGMGDVQVGVRSTTEVHGHGILFARTQLSLFCLCFLLVSIRAHVVSPVVHTLTLKTLCSR